MIPKQLQQPDFRFVLLKAKAKIPFENKWQENGYRFNDSKLLDHFSKGGNYGCIGGYGRLRILDIDNQELAKEMVKLFNTFTIKTGSQGVHLYFLSDYETNHVLIDKQGELRANNYQVVSAGSTHPNGNKYKILEDKDIREIKEEELLKILKPFLRDENTSKVKKEVYVKGVGLVEVEQEEKKDTSRSAFEYRKVISLIREGKKEEEVFIEMDKYAKWATAHLKYKEATYQKAFVFVEEKSLEKKEGRQNYNAFTIEGQVNQFYDDQPFFFDKVRTFHLWNEELFRWEASDEIDMLNNLKEYIPNSDTISAKTKGEIMNALKQLGRKKKPEDMPKTWIQFKDKIVDVLTEEEFEATPKYYTTNPLPWKLGETNKTPTIDRLIKEWVVDDVTQDQTYIKTMKQIIAYIVSSDQFLQRLIALCGAGSNGKGTYVALVSKFIGMDNSCTSDLRILATNDFEASSLYKKLLCIMGEVDATDLKNTNTIKKLSGEDVMRYEFKGKGSFSETSGTTCLISTNSLPITPDKSMGFYRRWLIIDFPHQFAMKRDLIGQIPDEEFENLGRCVLELLKEMYETNAFDNEGNLINRETKYEERSNPVVQFIGSHCEEDFANKIELRGFCRELNSYLKKKHLRAMSPIIIGKILRNEGYETSTRKISRNGIEVSAKFVIGISLITTQTTQTTRNWDRNLRKKMTQNFSGLSGLSGSPQETEVSKEIDDIFNAKILEEEDGKKRKR